MLLSLPSQQMSDLVLESLRQHGTKVIMPAVPTAVSADTDLLKVSWIENDRTTAEDTYQTVLMAIGEFFYCVTLEEHITT